MNYYAVLNEQGKPLGFYVDSIHKSIPDNAVSITEEVWRACVDNQGKYLIVNGQLQDAPPIPVDTTPQPPTIADRLDNMEAVINEILMGGV